MWADARSDNGLKIEKQFLHNTKIVKSAINEKKAFNESKQSNLPFGRIIGMPQMLHQLIGDSEIETNLIFIIVPTLPFELRGNKKLFINPNGELKHVGQWKKSVSDGVSMYTDCYDVRHALLDEGYPLMSGVSSLPINLFF